MTDTDNPPMNLTKSALRQHFKQRRRHMASQTKDYYAGQIAQHWQTWLQDKAALTIGTYLATSVECPTEALHQLCWPQGHRLYAPLLSQPGQWAELRPDSLLQPTALGIFEPVSDRTVSLANFDVLLLPLLAIDREGYRLGYGAGFYDRLLAEQTVKPLLIGLGFHQQLCQHLPYDPWDIPLDGFLSERGLLFFPHSQRPV